MRKLTIVLCLSISLLCACGEAGNTNNGNVNRGNTNNSNVSRPNSNVPSTEPSKANVNNSSPTNTASAPTTKQADLKIKGNKNSMIYHLPNCPDYSKISEKNVVLFNTKEDAEKAGYRMAKNCH